MGERKELCPFTYYSVSTKLEKADKSNYYISSYYYYYLNISL